MRTLKKVEVSYDCRGMNTEEIIDTILELRNIDDVEHFLFPTEEDLLPMDNMGDMSKASKLIDDANKILIFADVDLDGCSSCAIMYRYLKMSTDKDVDVIINQDKSHGLQYRKDLELFLKYDLVIIVDSLDANIDKYKYLHDNGINVIVLDHHKIERKDYNDYIVLISSQYDGYNNKNLSGAGVCWKFCKYLDSINNTNHADDLIDLCACGLSADMMDMTDKENRYLMHEGLNNLKNPAIIKMKGSYPFTTQSINYSIAPLINASVRMNENDSAMNVFLHDDNKIINEYLRPLKKSKDNQNKLVDKILLEEEYQLTVQKDKPIIVLVVDSEYGITGLIGNKLLEKYKRPVLVIKDCGDKYMGSMRAIGVEDFSAMVNRTGLAVCKGHELASGFECDKNKFDEFLKTITEELNEVGINTDIKIHADIQLNVEDITEDLIREIKMLDKISGTGFEQITVYVDNVDDYYLSTYSNGKHLVINPHDGFQIIKWNWVGDWEEMKEAEFLCDPVWCVGTLDSGFIGRNFYLQIICKEVGIK